ncbi:MAG TPA: ABC transporter permease [Candidatus Sulfotelmatobacter sp.]|nr:ABC transporter permease [Candidatus Sulfotelmatobacter sp.]
MSSGNAIADHAAAGFELQPCGDGTGKLRLNGCLDLRSTAALWRNLDAQLRQAHVTSLEVDASGVEYCDGAGLALLHFLSPGGLSPFGGKTTVTGLRPEFLSQFQKFTAEDYERNRPQPIPKQPVVNEVGVSVTAAAAGLKDAVAFIGSVVTSLAVNLTQRKAMRWREVWRIFETAGIDALPIISLISLLVGLIIAFEAVGPFSMFGAQIFIANMLGVTMARELSGLMTAIILAGRSGSAFAAELGTMKVNEELNALETMGLSPMRFLVVQRVLAGILLTPLLTIYSILIAITGGVLVMLSIGFPLVTIYNHIAQTMHWTDIVIGVGKGVIFGALIAGVGCLRGLQTRQGPSAVGDSTTGAVVTGILLVIVADAVVAVMLFFLDL